MGGAPCRFLPVYELLTRDNELCHIGGNGEEIMKKLLLLVCCLALASGCSRVKENIMQKPPIKVGGIFDMTGPSSYLDIQAAKGAQLAVKEINAAGGVLGRPLQFILRDSQSLTEETVNAAKKAVDEDGVVAAVGLTETDSVLLGGPVFQKAGIPVIAVGATSPKLTGEIGDCIYLVCYGDNVQAAAAAEYAYNRFGTNGYLLYDCGATYPKKLAIYFMNSFEALGGQFMLFDEYSDGTTDMAGVIKKVQGLPVQPDFYFISGTPEYIAPIVKQFRAAGLAAPIVGGDSYDSDALIKDLGQYANNIYFTTHAYMDAIQGSPAVKRFMAAYNKEYGADPRGSFAALGYDAVYLLADAINRAGVIDPDSIKKSLSLTRNLQGVTGSYSMKGSSHVPLKSVDVVSIQDQKTALDSTVEPKNVPEP